MRALPDDDLRAGNPADHKDREDPSDNLHPDSVTGFKIRGPLNRNRYPDSGDDRAGDAQQENRAITEAAPHAVPQPRWNQMSDRAERDSSDLLRFSGQTCRAAKCRKNVSAGAQKPWRRDVAVGDVPANHRANHEGQVCELRTPGKHGVLAWRKS